MDSLGTDLLVVSAGGLISQVRAIQMADKISGIGYETSQNSYIPIILPHASLPGLLGDVRVNTAMNERSGNIIARERRSTT